MKILIVPEDKVAAKIFLLQNKIALMVQKKSIIKYCDGLNLFVDAKKIDKGLAFKADQSAVTIGTDALLVKAIINTTNFLDSCLDCHMPGIWTKSLNENKLIMHLQEHDMAFDKIISDGDDLKASAKNYTWKSLGYDYAGSTQALLFDSTVKKKRNPFMYEQYAAGYVKNHSVGMQYIKIILCINEPDDIDYGAEFEAWEKYYPAIANKDYADEMGYFWAILEAKVIEGSAVPRGANSATPTLSVTEGKSKSEPDKSTPKNIYARYLPAQKMVKIGGLNVNLNKL